MGSYTKSQRQKLAAKGQAMENPDTGGDYPIDNAEDVKDAVHLVGKSKHHSTSAVKRHIIKVAKKIGAASALPEDWNVKAENGDIVSYLSLEDPGMPGLSLETVKDNKDNGILSVRVPFFIGNSLANIPGFDERLYFNASALPGLIAEGQARITEAKRPINVFARHAHAHSQAELPIGVVRGFSQKGSVGYADLDIISEGLGAQAQSLIRNKMLNAVSLRSKKGNFEVQEKSINGEDVLEVTQISIDGIDFAPELPAMETYGIEQLAAESVVSDRSEKSEKEADIVADGDLNLENVRKRSDIVLEIERPLREQVASLTAERDSSVKELGSWKERAIAAEALVAKSNLEAFLREIASSFADPAATYGVLAESVKDAKSKEEAQAIIMPVLLRGLKSKKAEIEAEAPKSKAEKLFDDLFPTPANGAGSVNLEGDKESAGIGAEQTELTPPD